MSEPLKIDLGSDELLAEIRGGVATVTLNRPHARNALSEGITRPWSGLFERLENDRRVGAILITGAGNSFCAGGDIKRMGQGELAGEGTFEERVSALRDNQRRVIGALVSVTKPTIAALPGPAAGAGLGLALACDLRIAAASAFLTTAYARVALSGDYGTAWLLTRLVGPSRARELMFFSERLDARRAEALGLVNRVVPDEELQSAAFAMAASLAAGPRFAFACMKQNLDHALNTDVLESMDFEAETLIRTEVTQDHAEAVRAFAEKRPAVFARD